MAHPTMYDVTWNERACQSILQQRYFWQITSAASNQPFNVHSALHGEPEENVVANNRIHSTTQICRPTCLASLHGTFEWSTKPGRYSPSIWPHPAMAETSRAHGAV